MKNTIEKYHINDKEEIKPCQASEKSCQFDQHYDSREHAQSYLDTVYSDEKFSTLKKNDYTVVVKPAELGYHCNGDCWRGPEYLVQKLSKNVELRDWFVKAEWATEDNLVTVSFKDLENVHPTQNFVNMSQVKKYIDGEDTGTKKFFDQYPTLFKFEDKWYIFQGTHRLTAAKILRDKNIKLWKIDLDSMMR